MSVLSISTQTLLGQPAASTPARPLRFLIAGASGLIGAALIPFLQAHGHAVTRLVRRTAQAPDEVQWDPESGKLSLEALRGMDVVINLGGVPVAEGRWTSAQKAEILRSRVDGARTLSRALALAGPCSHPVVFISASATGYYGDRGDEVLTEASSLGRGFLAEVCKAWERETFAAEEAGVRVVRLRTGIVLTPAGGALAKLIPVFRSGLGGRISWGRVWMSWISIDDIVGVIYHAVLDRRCEGALNAVAPTPVTNADFARTLGRVLKRPAFLPVPGVFLKVALGEMAAETVLASTRVSSGKLQASAYAFRHETLEPALRHVLGRPVTKAWTLPVG